jgi:class 3 adenylate cyclase
MSQSGRVFLAIESATILFTDVVGSTELAQRLSPDAAEEVRRGHFSILRQAIAEAGGTEVKNLGDGLMVIFGRPLPPWPVGWRCSSVLNGTIGTVGTRWACEWASAVGR